MAANWQEANVQAMRQAASILVALSVLCGSGCRQNRDGEELRRRAAEDFGRLPGLRESPHPKLREELARIVDEAGTPELLAGTELPDDVNAAAGLKGLFAPSKLPSILETSGEILPPGDFKLSPTRLERAIRFRRQHESQRRQAREALKRPKCSFPIQHELGFAAELGFADAVRICARLEAFQAAEGLAGNDLAAAIESLGSMFRLAACLAAEKHPTVRVEAAFVRAEARRVLQAIVAHPEIQRPQITRPQLEQLDALIREQLKTWPDDADAWIGDRALGMVAYELVRAGRLADLLTEEEAARFEEEGILAELPAAARQVVNEDELYYLEAMRRIIDACRHPYYKRAAVFEAIREQLHEQRNSPEFPVVAARLLLPGVEKGHAIQARDRASCEAWALALAQAAGRQAPPYQISPLTGSRYEIVSDAGLIAVHEAGGAGSGRPMAVVPDLAGRPAESTGFPQTLR